MQIHLGGNINLNINDYEGNAKTYINEYVAYLQSETSDEIIAGNLITLEELQKIGCVKVNDSRYDCQNSEYASWIVNGSYWWTRTTSTEYDRSMWGVNYLGGIQDNFDGVNGIRPTITISKATLENL